MYFAEPFGGLINDASGTVLSVLLRTGMPLTGRGIHAMIDDYSLWSVQQALKTATDLGLVNSRTVGRAHEYTINESHYAVKPLRQLLSPVSVLADRVREAVGSNVDAVILFGSLARGEASAASDIDLAVIAAPEWDSRADLAATISAQFGNDCDVLVFTPEEFAAHDRAGEPVAKEIIRDGILLVGNIPDTDGGAK